jgi:hypothetical protein
MNVRQDHEHEMNTRLSAHSESYSSPRSYHSSEVQSEQLTDTDGEGVNDVDFSGSIREEYEQENGYESSDIIEGAPHIYGSDIEAGEYIEDVEDDFDDLDANTHTISSSHVHDIRAGPVGYAQDVDRTGGHDHGHVPDMDSLDMSLMRCNLGFMFSTGWRSYAGNENHENEDSDGEAED